MFNSANHNRFQISPMLFLFLFSLGLTAGSFILQFVFHLEPCSLCMIARALVIALTLLFGVALLHQPRKRGESIYRLLGGILATFGILVTARHIWILHLPPAMVPDCIPNIDYLLEILPLKEAFLLALRGSHECHHNNTQWLGLSLPTWTLCGFLVIVFVTAMPWKKWRKKKAILTIADDKTESAL